MTRIRKTTYLVPDEYDWAELFAQFKENPNAPHVARVRRILELLKELTPGVKKRPDVHVLTELNARLVKYQWRSLISPTTQGCMEFFPSPMGATGPDAWEYDAVRWLLDLFRRHGELDRVHLCKIVGKRPECKGWFYGRPNKPFCCGNCKQYQHDSQDEVKARRAKNAENNRAYRTNLKRREDREKQMVGYKGRFRLRAKKAGGTPPKRAK
jgi:hypothetical protein